MRGAQSVAGDRPPGYVNMSARDPVNITLGADYFQKWEEAARDTSYEVFAKPSASVPQSYLRVWGTAYGGDGTLATGQAVNSPVEGVVLGVIMGPGVNNSAGVFCGVRDNFEAARISCNCFVSDLNDAVKAVILKHNTVFAEVAQEHNIPTHRILTSKGAFFDLANMKSHQLALAALDLALPVGCPIEEARVHQASHRCVPRLEVAHSGSCPSAVVGRSPIEAPRPRQSARAASVTSEKKKRRDSRGSTSEFTT